MATEETTLVATFRDEGNSLASAVLASITPRMVNRLGGVAESTIAALDLLTSPGVVTLLAKVQKAAPVLAPLLDQVGELGSGVGMDGLAARITRAVAAGQEAVRSQPQPITVRQLVHMVRRDPALAFVLHFFLGFVRDMWLETETQGTGG